MAKNKTYLTMSSMKLVPCSDNKDGNNSINDKKMIDFFKMHLDYKNDCNNSINDNDNIFFRLYPNNDIDGYIQTLC